MAGSAAEKWYQYEEDYRRYGFDMEPEVAVPRRSQSQRTLLDSIMENQGRIMAMVVAVGTAFIILIASVVWITNLTRQVNDLTATNQDLTIKRDSIEFQIKEANSISYISSKARKLGMVQAESRQYVHIGKDGEPEDMSIVLKEGKVN